MGERGLGRGVGDNVLPAWQELGYHPDDAAVQRQQQQQHFILPQISLHLQVGRATPRFLTGAAAAAAYPLHTSPHFLTPAKR